MQKYQSKLLNHYTNLLHTFTTKDDGNLAFHVHDKPKHVLANHKELATLLAYDLKKLVHMKQIHSNIVKIVDENDNFDNPPTCDALITNRSNVALMVMVADCTPVLFYDPKQKVIAVAHAGRAGAFENIIGNVIQSMSHNFRTNSHNILVATGPAICKNCYEVDEKIYKEACNKKMHYAVEKEKTKYYLDIRAILHKELREEGIQEKNIDISPLCSQCHPDFFSYREDAACGRFSGVLMLR